MSAHIDPTALFTAAARALETNRPDGLISDPYAANLLDAAGGVDLTRFPQDLVARVRDSNVVRTVFLDEVTEQATSDGPYGEEDAIRQVVLLGAGLDARPWRLSWPAGTTIYRLDRPGTLEFVTDALGAPSGADAPSAVNVAADLGDDWPASLMSAGFDRTSPTLWIAEGVLFYLASDTAEQVCQEAAHLSPPGSVFSFAHFGPGADAEEQTGVMAATAGAQGASFASTITRPEDLLATEQWDIFSSTTIAQLGATIGRPAPYEEVPGREVTWLAAAQRRT